MRYITPQIDDIRIVKRFALFPVEFDGFSIWMETIYFKEQYIRHREYGNGWWSAWLSTKEVYDAYKAYQKSTGEKYMRQEPAAPPSPPQTGSGVRPARSNTTKEVAPDPGEPD